MNSDWIEITSVEQVKAFSQEAQAAQRAEMHAKVDELLDGLELEAKKRIDSEINTLLQLLAYGRKLHAEQRVLMHAKIDQFCDDLDIKAMAQVEGLERHLVGAPVH